MPASAVALPVALALAFAGAPAPEPVADAGRSDRRLDAAVPRAVPWPADGEVPAPVPVDAAGAGADGEDDGIADDGADEAPAYDPVRDSPEGLQARRRIIGGVALTVVGSVLTIGAIALGASDPCRPLAGNSCQAGARNRAAWVLGVPGAVILAGGITLLTLGLVKRRRLAAGVTASRQGGGVSLSGRF